LIQKEPTNYIFKIYCKSYSITAHQVLLLSY